MELSYDTIQRIIPQLESGDWQYCSEYGEPGYSFRAGATTPIVVMGDYWCRCDKFGIDDNGRNNLHSYDQHHPKVWAQMESQGVEFEWDDEWVIDYDNDKCYRTSGDSYSWQSSVTYTEHGDMLTPDDDLDSWLEYMVNEPTRCLPSRVFSTGDLVAAGFETWNGTYENGWHPGQTDDPKMITDEIREEKGDTVEIVFLLDESSQFYIGFSAWVRETDNDNDDNDNGQGTA